MNDKTQWDDEQENGENIIHQQITEAYQSGVVDNLLGDFSVNKKSTAKNKRNDVH